MKEPLKSWANMAKIHSVNSPLVIKFSDQSEQVVACCFKHQQGLLYLDLFWHKGKPQDTAHIIQGTLEGDGPWKIGGCSIRLLGCANTDPTLQQQYLPWKAYLEQQQDEYPPAPQVQEIAKRLGAIL